MPAIIHIFSYTANAVSAHHGLAAIGIEDAHFEIGGGAGKNANNAIGPCAEMPVGILDCKLLNVFGHVIAVHVQVIVSQAVHFSEIHGVSFFVHKACTV